MSVELLPGGVRCQLGESPLWSVAEAALYWVDIEGRAVHRHALASGRHESWPTPERVGCIALAQGVGLVAAMETGIFHLATAGADTGKATLLHPARFPLPGMRFNDGRCDRQGRLWASSMCLDTGLARPAGALYRCNADSGLSAPLVDGLIVGNGLAFSPDGATMYLSDSHASVQKVWAFDLDEQGLPTQRRLFIDFQAHRGRPDGAAVDAEGGYWICANDGGAVLRFDPTGRFDRLLPLPVAKPSMCAFGGPRLDLLFITSIVPAQPLPGYEAQLAGAVLVADVGVRGLAETPWRADPVTGAALPSPQDLATSEAR